MIKFEFDASKYDAKKTFGGLRTIGREIAEELRILREQNKAELKKIEGCGIYTEKYIANKRAEFRNAEAEAMKEGFERFGKACSEVLNLKRKAVDEMIATPPTQEQLNLLQSLQMQGKSLTQAEIERIMPQLANNYRALKTMQSIGDKAGYKVYLPAQYDFDEITKQLDRAEQYLKARAMALLELDRINGWHLDDDAFFGPSELADYKFEEITETLDGNEQTAPVIEPVKELSEAEATVLKNLFADKFGDDLKQAVADAMKSPALAELVNRSEYAAYITE